MYTEKSTYQLFEDAKNKAVLNLLIFALFIFIVVTIRTCFISPATIEKIVTNSEKQAFKEGVRDATK